MKTKPILYIKNGCFWCNEALSFFAKKHIETDVRDVLESPEDMLRMQKITEQTLTPSFEYGDFIVADFSIDEFMEAIDKAPEVKKELGLQ